MEVVSKGLEAGQAPGIDNHRENSGGASRKCTRAGSVEFEIRFS